jgi:NAD-reducing hydrogenase large subunit
VNEPLTVERRDEIRAMIPEAIEITQKAIRWFKGTFENFRVEIDSFANFPSLFLGLVTPDDRPGYYEGKLRFVDGDGKIVADRLEPARYPEFIEEAVEPFTFMKFPYYKPLGYPGGMYRVGPLARLNLTERCGTPLAEKEWKEFRGMQSGAVLSSFHYHLARLIEILHCTERMEEHLEDPELLDTHVRSMASINNEEGIGAAEAPRGTLIHHYKVNEEGLITAANLLIATGHNNLAMNRGLLQTARQFVRGEKITDGMLNRAEAVIRTFDPCLSCSTHAFGRMPLEIRLVAPGGELLDEARRRDA